MSWKEHVEKALAALENGNHSLAEAEYQLACASLEHVDGSGKKEALQAVFNLKAGMGQSKVCSDGSIQEGIGSDIAISSDEEMKRLEEACFEELSQTPSVMHIESPWSENRMALSKAQSALARGDDDGVKSLPMYEAAKALQLITFAHDGSLAAGKMLDDLARPGAVYGDADAETQEKILSISKAFEANPKQYPEILSSYEQAEANYRKGLNMLIRAPRANQTADATDLHSWILTFISHLRTMGKADEAAGYFEKVRAIKASGSPDYTKLSF